MNPVLHRLALCVVLFTPALVWTQQKPPVDPAEARLRTILGLQPTFKAYIFAGDAFPACDFGDQAKAKELLGDYAIKVTYYDASHQPCTQPKAAGVYGVIVEVKPEKDAPFRRYYTLYRLPQAAVADLKFAAASPEALAQAAGLDPQLLKQEAALIAEVLKDQPFSAWSNDARAARLLAGLSRQKPGNAAARKNADAFALERQWWVDLRRKSAGLDKKFARPFALPRPLDGQPAPVVRAGTLAEAGMKPDAADKIDAVLKTWAENDDQAFAVCIVRNGVIVLHKAYGTRDDQPMTVQTKSWMASITKTMSASLMWQLVEQGLVDLDDPIDKYLPGLAGVKLDKPLTIRHLYTHTNGLNLWPGWHDDLPDVDQRLAQYAHRLRLNQEFGYNGTGYILGGKIIENVTGEAIPLCFQKHLLDPLGCPDTDVLGTHADARSVPLDIARFGQLLLNGGSYGKQQFWSAKTFERMLPAPLTLAADAKPRSFGIGLDGKPEKFGHGAASAATFSVDRTDNLVVVMTRNKMGKNQDKYNGKFWDAIRQGIER